MLLYTVRIWGKIVRYGSKEQPTRKAGRLLQEQGFWGLIKAVAKRVRWGLANIFYRNTIRRWLIHPAILAWHKTFRAQDRFSAGGKQYSYFFHLFNSTWANERAVEIPVVWDYVLQHQGKRILEVGNVLAHYFDFEHDILDKFDQAKGVINQDVVDFRPASNYDLIVSISTLEHVGFDEEPKDPGKFSWAVDNLKKCLNPGGQLVVTLPLGYNLKMDEKVLDGSIAFDRKILLKRVQKNEWREVTLTELGSVQYDHPYYHANGLLICIAKE